MKKTLKTLLIFILMLPIVILSACTSPTKYQITVNPSDSNLGSIPEATTLNFTKMDEGTYTTFTAKENLPETNPFICWVKDYKKVVSKEKTYELVYNSQSAGNYTALFKENDVNKMLFASLNKINFEAVSETYSTANYVVRYARTSSGSSTYSELESGSFSLGETYHTNNESILYFGGAGVNSNYKIKVNIDLVTISGASTSLEIDITSIISKASFNGNAQMSVAESYVGYGDLTLTFAKITPELYE